MHKLIILAAFALAACTPHEPLEIKWGVDQCARREIFQQCLKAVPAGPTSIVEENDWEEVVEACADTARDQAVRNDKHVIKPECL